MVCRAGGVWNRLAESRDGTLGRCEMRCKRCHGMVVVDVFLDGSLDERMSGLGGWRCINCGEWLDIGVLRNRAASRSRRNQVAECLADNSVSLCTTE
jgi:hypothetical protein